MLGKTSNLPTFVLTEAQQYVFNFISEPQVFLFNISFSTCFQTHKHTHTHPFKFPQETLKEQRVAISEHVMTCLKVHQLPPLKKTGNESKIITQKGLEKKNP